MRYPVAVWNTEGVYSAEVPDLPGVITEANSIEELESSVKEAAFGWIECVLDENKAIPKPSYVDKYLNNPDYQDCLQLFVDFSIDELSDKTERVNITLPARVLRKLDNQAKRAGATRSGYIASMILSAP